MDTKTLPTPGELRQLLTYDPSTGKMFWKERGPEWFPNEIAAKRWNGRLADKEAFTTTDAYGYKIGAIFNIGVKAHRVAFAIHHGEWPDCDVDHVNRDRSDNRIANLRASTRAQNLSNMRNQAGVSGYIGVHPSKKRWVASINDGNKKVHIGSYLTPEEAAKARDVVAVSLRGEFAELNFPITPT